jgi:uncharacterized protein YjbI with pentapeptide repeats
MQKTTCALRSGGGIKDGSMSFYGRQNRILVEQALEKGEIKDSQISECELSNLAVKNVQWDHTDMRDLHANDIAFENTKLGKSVFFRSSFMRASFDNAVLNTMTLDGLTLIKSRWHKCRLADSTVKNVCMQKSVFSGDSFISSSMLDFEALDMQINNCVFAHSMFNISYGSGMNGFSGAVISNCVFYHCRFEGYPLRGAKLSSCVFVYCSGEIGDDMECSNVAGIGLRGRARTMPLKRAEEARRLVLQYAPQGRA